MGKGAETEEKYTASQSELGAEGVCPSMYLLGGYLAMKKFLGKMGKGEEEFLRSRLPQVIMTEALG